MPSEIKPGMTVYCKKRTKWHEATVVSVYEHPRAVKIKYGIGDEWILRPEEVKTEEEKLAEEKAERDAQGQ
jgi:hypothetical protein